MTEKLVTKIMTPKFRVSFAHVFKPHAFKDQAAKFSVTMLFDQNADLKPMRDLVKTLLVKNLGPDTKKWPKGLKIPFRDGNEKEYAGYANCTYVMASSKERPGVIDRKNITITEEDGTFYSGCYARATVNAYYYDAIGNKGVAFGLNNIQKMEDGEEFSGRKAAKDDFTALDGDSSDDAASYAKGPSSASEDGEYAL